MSRPARRRGLRVVAFVGAGLAVCALAGAAFAYWASTDSSNPAAAVADSIPAGSTPTLGGIDGQDVTLSWTATTTAAGVPVTGYGLARYSVASGGSPTVATGGCSGTVAALTCTEQSAPAGIWYYAVTPEIALWQGTESGRVAVTVIAASLSVTGGQTLGAPGTVTGGSISHFKSGETVVFRLDSAGGTALTASISAVDGTGSASGFTVSIPVGVSGGSHTIVAVGGGGSQATSNSFTVDATPPVTTDDSASIGSSWFNTTKTVTLSPTDAGGVGVAATYFTSDGSTPTTASSQGTSVVLASDGVYTAKYFSVDAVGNAEAIKTAGTAIRIDKTSPTPGAVGVAAAVKNGAALTSAATDPTVNGASSGVASVSYYYCSGAGCTPSTLIGTGSTGPNYSVTWSSQPADGTYRVQAVATDVAGNAGSSSIASTIVDNTAPSGGSVTYTNGYLTTASVGVTMANGADGGSGINTATTQLLRTSTTLAAGACGSFGSPIPVGAAGSASPYTDTSVASASCYQYQYQVSDNAGNTSTYTSSNAAKVDTTAPVFTVTSTGTNVSWSGTTVHFKSGGAGSFTATAGDPESGVSSSTFPATFTGWAITGTGNARTFTLGSANSSSSITVSATNGAGSSSGNQTVTTTVDGTQPVFANTDLRIAPIGNTTTPGYIHQGGQYYVYANASDAGSGIGTVTANVNNLTTGQTAVPLVAGTYNVSGTTYGYRSAAITANAALTAGSKNYTGTATDNVGNAGTTANATAVVDNTNPTGSITAPSNGWAAASTTVTSNSADASAGIYGAQFQYSPAGAGTWTTIATDTSSPYSVTWDTTSLTNGGSYDLRVISTDNASNTFTSAIVTVTVDRTAPAAPSTPVLAPASDSGVSGDNITNVAIPTFTGTAEAGTTVKLYIQGYEIGSGTATGGNYSITSLYTIPDGTYTVTATATDPAGNVSPSSGGLVFTVDTTAATPIGVTLANGGVAQKIDTNDTVTIQYSEQVNASTFCSTWTNSGTQTLNNVTVTVGDAKKTDYLSLSTPSCTFNLSDGGDTLLTADYVGAGPATFTSSTVTWNPATNTLTLTLGTLSTSSTINTGVAAKAPKYTPTTALADLAGNTMARTAFTASVSGF